VLLVVPPWDGELVAQVSVKFDKFWGGTNRDVMKMTFTHFVEAPRYLR